METENDELFRSYVTLDHYAFGHTLDIVFIRNLHNNIIVERAVYKNSLGTAIYVYYDNKNKISTIQVKNLDIPQQVWDNAEQHIPKRKIYYKLRQFIVDVYDFCDVWELIGKTIAKTFYFNDRFFILTDNGEYSIADTLLENKLRGESGAQFTNIEVAKISPDGDYELRLFTTKGAIVIFGDDNVEYLIRKTEKTTKETYSLYNEDLRDFMSIKK